MNNYKDNQNSAIQNDMETVNMRDEEAQLIQETEPNTLATKKFYTDVFNVNTQKVEPHEITIAENGDFIFTATDGSFVKLPQDLDKDGIEKALKDHQEANKGRITLDDETKVKEVKLTGMFGEPVTIDKLEPAK